MTSMSDAISTKSVPATSILSGYNFFGELVGLGTVSRDPPSSDADPATGDTPVFTLGGFESHTRWDAGMVPAIPCTPPDEPVYLFQVTLSTDGNDYPILHFMDPNQPDQITGYNVYRSSDPAPPPST